MADTYGVTPASIAAELPGLFPGGFTANTSPTLALVTTFVAAADLAISLTVQNVAGVAPQAADRAAPMAVRYIVEAVKAQVLRIVYAGNAPADVAQATMPFQQLAADWEARIQALTTQAAGAGDSPNRVSVPYTTVPPRDLVFEDDQALDPASRCGRRF